MSRNVREHDLRVKGMGLGPRFALAMTATLALVMGVAGLVLYRGSTTIAEKLTTDSISRALVETHRINSVRDEGLGAQYEIEKEGTGESRVAMAKVHGPTLVERVPIRFTHNEQQGMWYYLPDQENRSAPPRFEVFVPGKQNPAGQMLGMLVGIMLVVVLVGAGMALWVAKQVTRPIHEIIEDVRQIAKGDLSHRTRAVGAGEIELLARSIDRMTRDLETAQGAEVELSIREREMDLATSVREALLPLTTPMVDGYDLGAAHLGSADIGGDFHDFIELDDGRIGLLVCDVSGQGVPAALIGATARSYLWGELHRGGDVIEAFRRVNARLGLDVRRGMFVTALYALVDPVEHTATVVCAGHKVPLLRHSAADGKMRTIHPEGIALGFDKGPVFDRGLEAQVVPFAEGDRLFLCNSAPIRLVNPDGRELGEKAFYSRVLQHCALDTSGMLKTLRRDILRFVDEDAVPYDVSLVTISRDEAS